MDDPSAANLSGAKFSGIITALVTPFKGGALDRDSFFRLLDRQTAEGISQFVVNGTTGESPALEEGEVRALCSWLREFEKGKGLSLQLILGTGAFSTKTAAEKTKKAAAMGADGALVVTPYYNRPSQRGLLEHFQAVAEAAPSLPILLYNVPSRTAVSLGLETVEALSAAPNIVGIKEASGDMDFFKKIRRACGEGFLLLSGDDGTAADSFFLGGDGVISVASHVLGREFLDLFQLSRALKADGGGGKGAEGGAPPAAKSARFLAGPASRAGGESGGEAKAAGTAASALEAFKKKHGDFLRELYRESSPVGIKQVLSEAGMIVSGEMRLPLKAPERIPPALKSAFQRLGKSFLPVEGQSR